MPPIIASTHVNRSAEDVFAYATDPRGDLAECEVALHPSWALWP
jgi:hypothetical protein